MYFSPSSSLWYTGASSYGGGAGGGCRRVGSSCKKGSMDPPWVLGAVLVEGDTVVTQAAAPHGTYYIPLPSCLT